MTVQSSIYFATSSLSSIKGSLKLTQYLDLLFSLVAGKMKSNKIIIFILSEDLRITSSISSSNLIYLGLAGVQESGGRVEAVMCGVGPAIVS